MTHDTKSRTLLGFIKEKSKVAKSALVTDEYFAYRNAGQVMPPELTRFGGYLIT